MNTQRKSPGAGQDASGSGISSSVSAESNSQCDEHQAGGFVRVGRAAYRVVQRAGQLRKNVMRGRDWSDGFTDIDPAINRKRIAAIPTEEKAVKPTVEAFNTALNLKGGLK